MELLLSVTHGSSICFKDLIYLLYATEVEEVVEVDEVAMVVVDAETTTEMADLLVQIGTTVAEIVQIHTDLKPEQFMYLKVIGWRTFFVFLLMPVWKLLS